MVEITERTEDDNERGIHSQIGSQHKKAEKNGKEYSESFSMFLKPRKKRSDNSNEIHSNLKIVKLYVL